MCVYEESATGPTKMSLMRREQSGNVGSSFSDNEYDSINEPQFKLAKDQSSSDNDAT